MILMVTRLVTLQLKQKPRICLRLQIKIFMKKRKLNMQKMLKKKYFIIAGLFEKRHNSFVLKY